MKSLLMTLMLLSFIQCSSENEEMIDFELKKVISSYKSDAWYEVELTNRLSNDYYIYSVVDKETDDHFVTTVSIEYLDKNGK